MWNIFIENNPFFQAYLQNSPPEILQRFVHTFCDPLKIRDVESLPLSHLS